MFLKAKEKINLRLQEVNARAKLTTLSSPACGNFGREQSWTKAVPFEAAN